MEAGPVGGLSFCGKDQRIVRRTVAMKRKILAVLLLTAVVSLSACVPFKSGKRQPKKNEKIQSVAGRIIPSYSMSIDANYDPRLNNLIDGYKLLPVIIKNMSLRNLIMDVKLDKWVVIGDKGQKYLAINSLRFKDRELWRSMPENMRALIEYPEIVPVNYSVTFDLFLPTKANLDWFREIRYFNAALQQEFILEKDY